RLALGIVVAPRLYRDAVAGQDGLEPLLGLLRHPFVAPHHVEERQEIRQGLRADLVHLPFPQEERVVLGSLHAASRPFFAVAGANLESSALNWRSSLAVQRLRARTPSTKRTTA